MTTLDTIFGYYDKLIVPLSPFQQAMISFLLLLVLIWQIYHVVRSGHWIFIALLIICLPGTWPAAKFVATLILATFKSLIIRIQAGL